MCGRVLDAAVLRRSLEAAERGHIGKPRRKHDELAGNTPRHLRLRFTGSPHFGSILVNGSIAHGGKRMKLGLHIVDYSWPERASAIPRTLSELARTAEETGFDAIAVADHVWQSPYLGGPEKSILEAYSVLSFLAAHTERVRLLAVATAAPYRAAGLLAKLVTTLDVLSGGRAGLGIGAGHFEEEARGLGLSLPPMKERFEVLEETILVCLQMWSGEHGNDQPFSGKHVRIERALNLPQSLSRPHPPILIAGAGERRTLPLVARYADACNIRPTPEIPRQLELLRGLCEAE